MPLIVACAIFAYLVATACAVVIMMQSANWRIRFLAFAIGLAPLCQSIILLGNRHIWVTPNIGHTAESLELSDSALCLAALHLLNKENRSRKGADTRSWVSTLLLSYFAGRVSCGLQKLPTVSHIGATSVKCWARRQLFQNLEHA
jgi:hypothetical protein